eukprot:668314-Rhodomonas_salina.3
MLDQELLCSTHSAHPSRPSAWQILLVLFFLCSYHLQSQERAQSMHDGIGWCDRLVMPGFRARNLKRSLDDLTDDAHVTREHKRQRKTGT